MSPDEALEQGLFEDYLHGRLGGARREAFERLYFEDEECFARLQVFLDAHRELAGKAPPRRWWRPPRLPLWALSTAAGVAAAAVGWTVLRTPPPAQVGVSDPIPAATPAPPPDLSALGQIDPPGYRPLTLRGGSAPDRAFREAMEPYREGRWEEAIAGLEPLARRSPGDAQVRFFLGACYLLAGRDAAGAEELQAVIALGPSPFLEEAHLYRARSLLRSGDPAAAREELVTAAALGGDLEPQARELLERLEQASRGR